jgi:hypothetical protein
MMERNPQIDLAERYVTETGMSLFLTGKAGTGKTTFLRHIAEHCPKRHVVVAPTGVAAVNAGGVTIHSFFQLPFCPYLPDIPELVTEYQMPEQQRQLRKSKMDIIRTLDLLIIDEISMVRADLLDAVDATLRRYRCNSQPFGGVQLLMIGDVQQLAPVVTEEERPYMERVYPSPFFFHSKALQRLRYVTIQLTTIYRQQDSHFVELLNNVRDNHFDQATLDALNSRVRHTPRLAADHSGTYPGSSSHPSKEGTANAASNSQHSSHDGTAEPILLTTHNYQADRVNQQRLDALKTEPFTLEARVQGNFPDGSAPTDKTLVLKPGAQVMFVKNDSSGAHRYYNGKIGTVRELNEVYDDNGDTQMAVVVDDEDGTTINVTPERWENIRYEIDPADNQIKQTVDGTFEQYPLKTAWAITIHKAQGLTFDRVQIDAAHAFTYGQVYVALSRCRSLEGLTLLSPISANNVFDSQDIAQFNNTLTPPQQAEAELEGCRTQYYYNKLFELFDMSAISHEANALERLLQEHLRSTYPQQAALMTEQVCPEIANLSSVTERFHRQLIGISQMPESDAKPILAERVNKATAYFLEQTNAIGDKVLPILDLEVDNKDVSKRLADIAERFRTAHQLKQKVLRLVHDKGFDIASYQKCKVDFVLEKPKKQKSIRVEETYADNKNPKLIKILTKWRTAHAKEDGLPAYTILTQKSLLAIADQLPRDRKSLLKISGIGAAKVDRFGAEIIQMVEDYCYDQEHPKEPAYMLAARLFAEGKSVEDVAGAMLRAISTTEGYLVTAVEKGILDPNLILDAEQQSEILGYIQEHPEVTTLKPLFEHFEGKYSYFQLRIAKHLI